MMFLILGDMITSTKAQQVPGGVDFSQAVRTDDGRLCVIKVFRLKPNEIEDSRLLPESQQADEDT